MITCETKYAKRILRLDALKGYVNWNFRFQALRKEKN